MLLPSVRGNRYTFGMLGETAPWRPESYLREHHPDVRVFEVDLPGGAQGCIDHDQRVIWLDRRLSPVERRCTLAYEMGQLQHGPTPEDPCLAAAHCRASEDWAARMLIPTSLLLDGFRCYSYIPAIAEGLEVDAATLRTRLRNLTDEEQDAVMDVIRGVRAVV